LHYESVNRNVDKADYDALRCISFVARQDSAVLWRTVSGMTEPLSVAVIGASLGRPENLSFLLKRLAAQTLRPKQVILSLESDRDAPDPQDLPFAVDVIYGPRGLCVQRNRALDRLNATIDIVIFYDDDFVPTKFSLDRMSHFFAKYPDIAGADGLVLKDGVRGPGLTIEEAGRLVDAEEREGEPPPGRIMKQVNDLYGCNMAYRVSEIGALRFDEDLPLYAWYEDVDFSKRIPGKLVQTDALRGVHCGEKRGRERNGKLLGYSQVANPLYMFRKGTLSFREAAYSVLRLLVANHLFIFRPEPWIDRRGRTVGNWIALADILRGRMHPRRILEMKP